jgi:hypothetical protein
MGSACHRACKRLLLNDRKTIMTAALPSAVRKAIDAANLGDTDAFLASFVPHLGVVNDWNREFRGTEAIRR